MYDSEAVLNRDDGDLVWVFPVLGLLLYGAYAGGEIAIWYRLWLLVGLSSLIWSFVRGAARDPETTFLAEARYACENINETLAIYVLLAPLGVLSTLFMWQSWREWFLREYANEAKVANYGMHWNTAHDTANARARRLAKDAERVKQKAHYVAVEGPPAAGRVALLLSVLFGTAKKADAEETKVTTSVAWITPYMVKNANQPHPKPVVQSDTTVQFPKGWAVNFLVTSDMEAAKTGGDEIDWKVFWANRNISAGLVFIDLSPQWSGKGGDVVQPYVEVRRTAKICGQTLTFLAGVDGVVVTTRTAALSAFFLSAGVRNNLPFGGFLVTQEFTLLRDSGVFGTKTAYVVRYNVDVARKLTERLTWTSRLRFFDPSYEAGRRKRSVVLGTGVSVSVR